MKPTLAVTMGDPAGIGPEVVVKAASVPDVFEEACLVVFGDAQVLARAAREIDRKSTRLNSSHYS